MKYKTFAEEFKSEKEFKEYLKKLELENSFLPWEKYWKKKENERDAVHNLKKPQKHQQKQQLTELKKGCMVQCVLWKGVNIVNQNIKQVNYISTQL